MSILPFHVLPGNHAHELCIARAFYCLSYRNFVMFIFDYFLIATSFAPLWHCSSSSSWKLLFACVLKPYQFKLLIYSFLSAQKAYYQTASRVSIKRIPLLHLIVLKLTNTHKICQWTKKQGNGVDGILPQLCTHTADT